MNRYQIIQGQVTKQQIGVEVAPAHSPIVPKRDGYNVRILDVFDTQTIREVYKNKPSKHRIEEVDVVADASCIGDHFEKNSLDYIVSSHNFEHIPNPIKYLQGCSTILKEGGKLLMAIPNLTKCYDRYKWPTTTADLLRSYYDNRKDNQPVEVFQCNYLKVEEPHDFSTENNFKKLKRSIENPPNKYVNIHAYFFTPTSFSLLMYDLNQFSYSDFILDEIHVHGNEFVVSMTKRTGSRYQCSDEERMQLHKKIIKELCTTL